MCLENSCQSNAYIIDFELLKKSFDYDLNSNTNSNENELQSVETLYDICEINQIQVDFPKDFIDIYEENIIELENLMNDGTNNLLEEQYEDAIDYLSQALYLANQHDAIEYSYKIYWDLFEAYNHLGKYVVAWQYLHSYLEMAENNWNLENQMKAYKRLSEFCNKFERYLDADEYYAKYLILSYSSHILDTYSSPFNTPLCENIAKCIQDMKYFSSEANIHLKAGNYNNAIYYLLLALKYFREHQRIMKNQSTHRIHCKLALIYCYKADRLLKNSGNISDSLIIKCVDNAAHNIRVIKIFSKEEYGPIYVCNFIGEMYCRLKRYGYAVEMYRILVDQGKKLNDKYAELEGERGLGCAHGSSGETHQAEIHYQRASELAKDLNDMRIEAKILIDLAWIRLRSNQEVETVTNERMAFDWAKKALGLVRKLGDHISFMEVYDVMTEISIKAERFDAATTFNNLFLKYSKLANYQNGVRTATANTEKIKSLEEAAAISRNRRFGH